MIITYPAIYRKVDVHKPTVVTDGGPWVEHDMPCPVSWTEKHKAVLDLDTAIFQPSWNAQKHGWMTICPPKWLRPLLRRYQRVMPPITKKTNNDGK
jgi:hypothetical protein